MKRILMLATILASVPAVAQDRYYRAVPDQVLNGAYHGLPGSVIAPDGSSVTPVITPGPVGNAGPCAYYAYSSTCTMQVDANGIDTCSVFYKWISGDKGVNFCINSAIVGYPQHQCLYFNGKTGAVASVAPAIQTYGVAAIGSDNWLRAFITFKTIVAGIAFPYIQFDALVAPQTAALWRMNCATGHSSP